MTDYITTQEKIESLLNRVAALEASVAALEASTSALEKVFREADTATLRWSETMAALTRKRIKESRRAGGEAG